MDGNDDSCIEETSQIVAPVLAQENPVTSLDSSSPQVDKQPLIIPENESFVCGICKQEFSTGDLLIDHLQNNHDVTEYECNICGHMVQGEWEFLKHKETHSQTSENSRLSCNICGKEFTSNKRRNAHVEAHGKIKPHSCDVCSKTFIHKISLDAHMTVHTGEFNYSCDICNKHFAMKGNYKQHMKNLHNPSKHCLKKVKTSFQNPIRYVQHKKISKPPIKTAWTPFGRGDDGLIYDIKAESPKLDTADDESDKQDQAVGEMFVTTGEENTPEVDSETSAVRVESLLTSDESHANSAENILDTCISESDKNVSYECTQCGKNFKNLSYLKRHIKVHLKDYRYACDVCGRVFNGSYNRERHMRVHTGAKPFTCGICGRDFRDVSVLQKHLRTHTKETPFKCNICGNGFKQSSTLQKHLKTHTDEPNPFTCSFCGVDVNDWATLRRHIKTVHHGILPCTCEICGKSFRDKTNLTRHLRTHQLDAKSICEVCGKEYRDPESLKKHLKKIHGQGVVRNTM